MISSNGVLKFPNHLFGRTSELATLTEMAVSARSPAAVFVQGQAGVGKTALLNALRQQINSSNGWCARGGFANTPLPVPYAGWSAALADLAQQLLAKPPPLLLQIRQQLSNSLQGYAGLLNAFAPAFKQIIGESPVPPPSTVDQPARLVHALRLVFGAVAAVGHPLVLCLDDLQWADVGSLEIARRLLLEPAQVPLLVIAAIRTETAVNPGVQVVLAEVQRQRSDVVSLALAPLDQATVTDLVAAAVSHSAPVDIERSAAALYTVTQGNPLLLRQVIQSPESASQWRVDPLSGRWRWEPAAPSSLSISDQVRNLLVQRLRYVSAESLELLTVAACAGYEVDPLLLGGVLDMAPPGVEAALQQSVAAGLLLAPAEGNDAAEAPALFRFVHGEVQQALLDRVPAEQQAAYHLQIGEYLLRTTEHCQRRTAVFAIVNHLNAALQPERSAMRAPEMVELLMEGARAALSITGIYTAAEYAQKALAWSATLDDGWRTHYTLVHAVYELAVRTALYIGDYARLTEYAKTVFLMAKTPADKTGVFKSSITAATQQGDYDRALELLQTALAEFGLHIPLNPGAVHVLDVYLRARLSLRGRTEANLLTLPIAPDRKWWEIGDLLTSAYMAMQWSNRQWLIAYLSLRSIRWSIQHGHSPFSVLSYTIYSMLLATRTHDTAGSYRFAQVATALSARPENDYQRAGILLTLNAFVIHHSQPLAVTIDALRQARRIALEDGDVRLATDCTLVYLNHAYLAGVPLTMLAQEGAALIAELEPYGETITLLLCRVLHQNVLNLTGESPQPWVLNTGAYLEEEIVARLQQNGNLLGLNTIRDMRVLLRLHFGLPYAAFQLANQAQNETGQAGLGLFLDAVHWEVDALARIAWLAEIPVSEHRPQLAFVRQDLKQLRRWAARSPANHRHRQRLVEGALARLEGRFGEAERAYTEAWSLAAAQGFVHDEAISAEFAARHFLRLEQAGPAEVWRQRARAAYERWGCRAKLRYLEQTTPFWLAQETMAPPPDVAHVSSAAAQPVGPLMELAGYGADQQALGHYADPRDVTQHLLSTLLVRLQARRAALLLVHNESLLLYAEQRQGRPAADYPMTPLHEGAPVAAPMAVIRLAMRQRSLLCLSAAEALAEAGADAYLAGQPALDILCSPLLAHGQPVAVLLVERCQEDRQQDTLAFTSAESIYAETLSAYAAVLIQHSHLLQRLTGDATPDMGQVQDAGLSAWLLGAMRVLHQHRDVTPLLQGRLRDLVAFLLLQPANQPILRTEIAAQLWPDAPEGQSLTNLRNLLHKLRSAWPQIDDLLEISRQQVQWRPAVERWVDVHTFTRGLEEAERLSGSAAIHQLRTTTALYGGDLLLDTNDEWLLPWREHLRERYAEALGRLVDLMIEQYDFAAAVHYAQQLANAAPLSEAAYCHLMRAHALSGNGAGARQAYNACAAMLAAEFNAVPSPATQSIYRRFVADLN